MARGQPHSYSEIPVLRLFLPQQEAGGPYLPQEIDAAAQGLVLLPAEAVVRVSPPVRRLAAPAEHPADAGGGARGSLWRRRGAGCPGDEVRLRPSRRALRGVVGGADPVAAARLRSVWLLLKPGRTHSAWGGRSSLLIPGLPQKAH